MIRAVRNGKVVYEKPISDNPNAVKIMESAIVRFTPKEMNLFALWRCAINKVPIGDLPGTLYAFRAISGYEEGRAYLEGDWVGQSLTLARAKSSFRADHSDGQDFTPKSRPDLWDVPTGLVAPYEDSSISGTPYVFESDSLYGTTLVDTSERWVELHAQDTHDAQGVKRPTDGVEVIRNEDEEISIRSLGTDELRALWDELDEYRSPEERAMDVLLDLCYGYRSSAGADLVIAVAPLWEDDRPYSLSVDFPRVVQHNGKIYKQIGSSDIGIEPSNNPSAWQQITEL